MDLIALYCRAQQRRGLASSTVDKRRRYLLALFGECPNPSREDIEDFLDKLPAAKSRAVVLSHVHSFYEWATDEQHLVENPSARIKAPKVPRKLPRPMPDTDLAKALANADKRMRCWLLLGALAGLRCKEVAGLCREDILEQDGLIRVVESKGGGESMVSLHSDVWEALSLYGLPTTGPLFRQRSGAQVTAGDVSHAAGDYLHGLGIKSTPHSLRHFFGTELLRATGNLRLVQEAMRHRNIASTVQYTALAPGASKVAVNALRVP